MTAAKKDTEPQREVSEGGAAEAPQPEAAPEFPKTAKNRHGVERQIHTIAQQVAAEYDGYTVQS